MEKISVWIPSYKVKKKKKPKKNSMRNEAYLVTQRLLDCFNQGLKLKKILSNQRNTVISNCWLCLFTSRYPETYVCLKAHRTINNHSGHNYRLLYRMIIEKLPSYRSLWTQRMEGPNKLLCCTGKNSKHLPVSVAEICSLHVHPELAGSLQVKE